MDPSEFCIPRLRNAETILMAQTNPFRPEDRHDDPKRRRANFWNSSRNFFKHIRQEGVLTVLFSLTWESLRPFHQRTSTRNWRNTRQIIQDFNRSITLIADIDALITSIVDRIKELFGTDRVILLHTYPDSKVFSIAIGSKC